jgi:hypothetical protein
MLRKIPIKLSQGLKSAVGTFKVPVADHCFSRLPINGRFVKLQDHRWS